MQKKFKEKYNESCIKIFKLYKLLYEDKAVYKDVIDIFTEDDEDKQHVILNKYLNTLKVFGIKVNKINNKFVMQNNPFGLKLDMNDIRSIDIFEQFVKILPNGKTRKNLEAFLKMILSKFDENANKMYASIKSTNTADFSFYYSDFREQIEKCETFCQESSIVDLKYLYKGKTLKCRCHAKQMIYDNKHAYIQVYKLDNQQLENILVSNIIEIESIPNQKSQMELPSSVTYKIKGRLASAYNIKENEYVQEVFSDGSKIIVAKNEPTDEILKRLIRYSNECVILAPKNIKNSMINTINDMLKNYE